MVSHLPNFEWLEDIRFVVTDHENFIRCAESVGIDEETAKCITVLRVNRINYLDQYVTVDDGNEDLEDVLTGYSADITFDCYAEAEKTNYRFYFPVEVLKYLTALETEYLQYRFTKDRLKDLAYLLCMKNFPPLPRP